MNSGPRVLLAGLNVPTNRTYHSVGTCAANSTSTAVILGAQAGGSLTVLDSTTGITFYVKSSSASDASAGTGLRTLLVEGFDINGLYCSEVITMNGSTSVTSTNATWATVFRAVGLTYGSGHAAAGNIFVADSDAQTNKYLAIATGGYETNTFYFAVPKTVVIAFQIYIGGGMVTTAGDGVRLVGFRNWQGQSDSVQIMDLSVIAAGSTAGICYSSNQFVFDGNGRSIDIWLGGLKVGTTNQTFNYQIDWGFMYK